MNNYQLDGIVEDIHAAALEEKLYPDRLTDRCEDCGEPCLADNDYCTDCMEDRMYMAEMRDETMSVMHGVYNNYE